jgi:hypothetical protein
MGNRPLRQSIFALEGRQEGTTKDRRKPSMSTPLLPQTFWFRLAVSCPKVEEIPRTRGRLLDLGDACALPDFGELDGRPSWARVRAGYNASGLGLSFEVIDKAGPISPEPGRSSGIDGVQIGIDTRDTRNVHRATRFCHRFVASIKPVKGRALEVDVDQKPIARAVADAPMARPGMVQSKAERTLSGWRLELFFPAESLHGFDPETNRRLGFTYQVTDPDRGEQFLGVGREFPIGEDPSLWATLLLTE